LKLNALLAIILLLGFLVTRPGPVDGQQQPPPISTAYAVTATPPPTITAPTPAPMMRQTWLPIIENH